MTVSHGCGCGSSGHGRIKCPNRYVGPSPGELADLEAVGWGDLRDETVLIDQPWSTPIVSLDTLRVRVWRDRDADDESRYDDVDLSRWCGKGERQDSFLYASWTRDWKPRWT